MENSCVSAQQTLQGTSARQVHLFLTFITCFFVVVILIGSIKAFLNFSGLNSDFILYMHSPSVTDYSIVDFPSQNFTEVKLKNDHYIV